MLNLLFCEKNICNKIWNKKRVVLGREILDKYVSKIIAQNLSI